MILGTMSKVQSRNMAALKLSVNLLVYLVLKIDLAIKFKNQKIEVIHACWREIKMCYLCSGSSLSLENMSNPCKKK